VLQRCRYVPRVIITDKRASYGAAKREIRPGVEHRRHKGLHNRAENAQQPSRQQERQIRRFTSPGQAQRFLAAFEPMAGHFRLRRHRMPAAEYRAAWMRRFISGNEVTETPPKAPLEADGKVMAFPVLGGLHSDYR